MSAARQNNADLKKHILVNVTDAKATDNDGTTLPWWAQQGMKTQIIASFGIRLGRQKLHQLCVFTPWLDSSGESGSIFVGCFGISDIDKNTLLQISNVLSISTPQWMPNINCR